MFENFKDGLVNLVTGLGSQSDPNQKSQFIKNRTINYDRYQLEALFEENPLAGRIAEIKPSDCTREWRQFTGDIDSDVIEQLHDLEFELDLQEKFRKVDIWGEIYGTAMLVISVDDGKDPSEPLEIDSLKPGCIRFLQVLDRTECTYNEIVDRDPLSPNYMKPLMYSFNESAQRIHHSRILRFEGVELPNYEFERNSYWSHSIYNRLYDILKNLDVVTNSMTSLAQKADRKVIKIDQLQQKFSNPQASENIMNRYATLNYLESTQGILLMDSQEELVQLSNSIGDLTPLQDKALVMLSAATDIPQTRLFGASPAGLSATGEGDMKNYVSMISSRQHRKYSRHLKTIDKIMAKHLGLSEEIDLKFGWCDLYALSEKEIAELRKTNAERDKIYIEAGVVSEWIVAGQLMEDDVYSNIDQEYLDDLEDELEELKEAQLVQGTPEDPNGNAPSGQEDPEADKTE